jgi:GNAT superfamily N-acetyltransferase
MAAAPVYLLRGGVPSDDGFILKTWVEALRSGLASFRRTKSEAVYAWAFPQVSRILSRAQVTVAAPPGDGETIYGYAVREPGIIHMTYVREPWRGLGIGRALLKDVDISHQQFSTWTTAVNEWAWAKYYSAPTGQRPHMPFWFPLDEEQRNGAGHHRHEAADATASR